MTFDLLTAVGGDDAMAAVFTEQRAVHDWLLTEAELAHGLAAAGIIDTGTAGRIAGACRSDIVDLGRLWSETAMVGYPIFPLVRMICAALEDADAGWVHYGATTQDIMDTALALQLRDAGNRLLELVDSLGEALAALVDSHAHTVMAGRTHAQQAVPTTFGAKCAGLLDELARHRDQLRGATDAVAVVSLHGAGGTSAALGGQAAQVRAELALRLNLTVPTVPWHVSRDRPARLMLVAAATATVCVRFAREMIDLARTEVGEVAEMDGVYRGASSTMPQKANPIGCELAVGFGVSAQSAAHAMFRASEAGHERAAGEWQIEWKVIPEICLGVAGALRAASGVAAGLRVFPERMRRNLDLDGGRIMAEAYMFALAAVLGRDHAHEVVYHAVRGSRESDRSLRSTLADTLPPGIWEQVEHVLPEAAGYLGETDQICSAATDHWRRNRSAAGARPPGTPIDGGRHR